MPIQSSQQTAIGGPSSDNATIYETATHSAGLTSGLDIKLGNSDPVKNSAPNEGATQILPLPTFIEHYRIDGLLSQGGMGVVYKAYDQRLQRSVALKTLTAIVQQPSSHQALLHRAFNDECKHQASLNHPNIVSIFHRGEYTRPTDQATLPYFVMEYVDGRSFTHADSTDSNKQSRTVNLRSHLLAQLFDAVAYLHTQGITHGDLKPANILITGEDEVKLIDFGASVALQCLDNAENASTRYACGTPGFSAPEQLRGDHVDHRADIYALGAVIFRLMSGECPSKRLYAEREASSDQVIDDTPALNQAWRQWLKKAMHQNPDKRFHTVEQMQASLPLMENTKPYRNALIALAFLTTSIISMTLVKNHHHNPTHERETMTQQITTQQTTNHSDEKNEMETSRQNHLQNGDQISTTDLVEGAHEKRLSTLSLSQAEKVALLIDGATVLIGQNKLIYPNTNNAMLTLQQVLQYQPDHSIARQLIAEIQQRESIGFESNHRL